eukprot:1608972-Rhodomonas_salina.2
MGAAKTRNGKTASQAQDSISGAGEDAAAGEEELEVLALGLGADEPRGHNRLELVGRLVRLPQLVPARPPHRLPPLLRLDLLLQPRNLHVQCPGHPTREHVSPGNLPIRPIDLPARIETSMIVRGAVMTLSSLEARAAYRIARSAAPRESEAELTT